jgi:transcriptional regulator with XRE-family HTH domain
MREEQPPTDRDRDPNVALGAAVRQLREQAKLGQGELAARAGLEEQEVVEIETGRLEPTWGDLRRIAYALEIPLSELLALTERLEKGD